jgi:hypothetical protein
VTSRSLESERAFSLVLRRYAEVEV